MPQLEAPVIPGSKNLTLMIGTDGLTYPDFSSCVLAGTKVANEVIINLTPEEINKDQLYVQFACIKKPDVDL